MTALPDDRMIDAYVLECPKCKFSSVLSDRNWQVLGCCDGQVMCENCHTHVEISTGREAVECGECDWCDQQ